MINGMLNAAAEIERWVRSLHKRFFDLYALPLFTGLTQAPPAEPT